MKMQAPSVFSRSFQISLDFSRPLADIHHHADDDHNQHARESIQGGVPSRAGCPRHCTRFAGEIQTAAARHRRQTCRPPGGRNSIRPPPSLRIHRADRPVSDYFIPLLLLRGPAVVSSGPSHPAGLFVQSSRVLSLAPGRVSVSLQLLSPLFARPGRAFCHR